ncbi:DMT family transporter [Halopseudomonas pelagia]|uniref:DMT family transporter n=1 Tax=Halopseudomonas pelagia TaxID=553151 RepID=UPI0003A2A4DA|nr:DMT family transporter [Halopseudomonas pelagia]
MARAVPCRFVLLTCLAMLAFAGNSLLCRLALRDTDIDPVSFTAIRILSGAFMLGLLMQVRTRKQPVGGDWRSALALFVYAAAFSLAYVYLPAGAGALLLFGAVQLTMTGWGLVRGERLKTVQTVGLILAVAGLLMLLLPGAAAPSLLGASLMLVSGVAWGIYSLLGRGAGDPLAATAGNFIRATPLALLLLLPFLGSLNQDGPGLLYALISGALTSGLGYALWYSALKGLTAIQGASVQLSVPVLAALGGALLLAENITLRLVLVAILTLGGIALVVWGKRSAAG